MRHRILFAIIVPVTIICGAFSFLLTLVLSPPLEAILKDRADAVLIHASDLGLIVCEERIAELIDDRLFDDARLVKAYQKETVEQIKRIGPKFPGVDMVIVDDAGKIVWASAKNSSGLVDASLFKQIISAPVPLDLFGKKVIAHYRYFPIWRWTIISAIDEGVYLSPIMMVNRIVAIGTFGVSVVSVAAILILFVWRVTRPLLQIIEATRRIAKGERAQIEVRTENEIAQVALAINTMEEELVEDRKQIQLALSKLAEYKKALESSQDIIFAVNPHYRYIFVNRTFLEYHKKGLEQVENQPLQKVLDKSVYESEIRPRLEKSMAGESVAFEMSYPYTGVGLRSLLVSYSPIMDTDGEVSGVVAVARDITERKQADEELRSLRNYLSNIINSMPSVLVGVDNDGNVTQWNRQAEKVTGLSFSKVNAQPLTAVFPRLKGKMDFVQTCIQDRRVLKELQVPRQHQDETRYEDVTVFPLVTDGVGGAVIRVDDVTERVRLEELVIQSEKMLSVGGLAAGMAHEINNPLAGMLQNACVLENRLSGDLPANHKAAQAAGTTLAIIRQYMELRKLPRVLKNIRTSGEYAANIVKNMLSFARKSEKVVSSQDLGRLLDQTLDLLRADYDMKKHYDFKKIDVVRQYDATAVPCEASKLQQVFMNILKNGAEAMAQIAGVKTTPAFVLRVRDDGDWVRVEIEDNGPGMDVTTRQRIFEPFFTTKPLGKGTGLGLSVAYFIVTQEHGGEMGVYTAHGGGTRFVIRLPKAGRNGF